MIAVAALIVLVVVLIALACLCSGDENPPGGFGSNSGPPGTWGHGL